MRHVTVDIRPFGDTVGEAWLALLSGPFGQHLDRLTIGDTFKCTRFQVAFRNHHLRAWIACCRRLTNVPCIRLRSRHKDETNVATRLTLRNFAERGAAWVKDAMLAGEVRDFEIEEDNSFVLEFVRAV